MLHIFANISLILSNILLGVSYSIIVGLLEQRVDIGALFTFEVGLGALVLIPFALLNPKRRRVPIYDLLHIGLCALITIYGWHYLILMGSEGTTPLDIAALSTLSPTITILAAVVAKRTTTHPRRIGARSIRAVVIPVVVLLIGALVVMHNTPMPTSRGQIESNIIILCGVISIGIATVIVSSLQQRYGTLTILAIYFAISLLVLPLFMPNFIRELLSLRAILHDMRSFALLLYQSIFGIIVPLYLLLWGAAKLTPFHTAIYRYIQPIIALATMVVSTESSSQSIMPPLRHLAMTLVMTLGLLLFATLLMPRESGVSEEREEK